MIDDQPGGPIRWRMHLPAPPERVFRALDTGEGRAAFWAESAEESGDGIHFHFIDGSRHVSRVVERDAPRRWVIEYFCGVAAFELAPDGAGGTDLLLMHTGVPGDEWHDVHAGWLNVLFPLKAWLAHGVDLRNHDPARTWEQGYADQ
ncbi:MAG: SRPBCC domain-containing protein [Gemmatimonadetes bacterium]|nr:SRPBCC domain-containing protein [Gemmatimonadota bacterium]